MRRPSRRPSLAGVLSYVAVVLALVGATAWLLHARGGPIGCKERQQVGISERRTADAAPDAGDPADLVARRDEAGSLASDASGGRAPREGRGALTGRVLTMDDAPIAGARVELYPEDGIRGPPIATASTDGDGGYLLDDLEPMTAALLVSRADGFVSALTGESDDPVRAGKTTPLEPIHLDTALSVSGRTVDVQGRPLAGVSVTTSSLDDPPVESDGDGRFTLRRVPQRSVHVRAEKSGYVAVPSTRVEIVPRPGAADSAITLTLAPTGSLRGSVKTRDGRPFPEAAISVTVERPLALKAGVWFERCEADGSFETDALPAGTLVSVAASSPWFADVEAPSTPVDGGRVELVVDPWPLLALEIVDASSGAHLAPNFIQVRVLDPRREGGNEETTPDPVEDLAWRRDEAHWVPRELPDGSLGVPFGTAIRRIREEIRDAHRDAANDSERRPPTPLPSEWKCELQVGAVGHVDAKVTFRVSAAETPPRVRIALEPAGSIAGRVVDGDGAPVAGALVRLFGVLPSNSRGWGSSHGVTIPDDHRQWFDTKSDRDGRFTLALDFVERKPAMLRVRARGFAPTQTEPFETVPRIRTEIEVRIPRGGVLEGRVMRGGVPARNRFVVAFRPDGLSAAVRCDGDGGYRFGALPSGRYQVRLGNDTALQEAAASSYSEGAPPRPPPDRCDVEIAEGAVSRFELDVDAPPGQGILGVLRIARTDRLFLHALAEPVEVVFRDPMAGWIRPTHRIAEDGSFRISDLDAGRWKVVIKDGRQDVVLAEREVTVQDGAWTPIEFEIQPRKLRGRIVDRRTGAPLQVDCWLGSPTAKPGAYRVLHTRSGADGGFAFDGVVSGEYRFRAPLDADSAIATVAVDLRTADVLDLTVEAMSRAAVEVDTTRLQEAGFELAALALERQSSAENLAPTTQGTRLVFAGLLPDTYALIAQATAADGTRRQVRFEVYVSLSHETDVTQKLLDRLRAGSK